MDGQLLRRWWGWFRWACGQWSSRSYEWAGMRFRFGVRLLDRWHNDPTSSSPSTHDAWCSRWWMMHDAPNDGWYMMLQMMDDGWCMMIQMMHDTWSLVIQMMDDDPHDAWCMMIYMMDAWWMHDTWCMMIYMMDAWCMMSSRPGHSIWIDLPLSFFFQNAPVLFLSSLSLSRHSSVDYSPQVLFILPPFSSLFSCFHFHFLYSACPVSPSA